MIKWLKEWIQGFIDKHGERLFFLAATTIFGIGFIYSGVRFKDSLQDQSSVLIGAGITLLIGAGQMCFNKSRSPEDKPLKIEGGNNAEIDA